MTLDLPARETVAALLAGVLETAIGQVPHVPGHTIESYILALCRAYTSTRATPRNMLRAAEGFDAIGDARSAKLCRDKAREEAGHDLLALKDITSLGLERNLPIVIAPPSAVALVALFDGLAEAARPYGVFGYAYVLEAIAAHLDAAQIAAIQRLSPGIDITRCLRVHAGGDSRHVDDLVDHVARLVHDDKLVVLAAVQATAPIVVAGLSDHEALADLTEYLAALGWIAPCELEAAL